MARVYVLREVREGDEGDWQLCFQWCRYVYDDSRTQFGYRFVWRRKEDGSIQAARGQARIPSCGVAKRLIDAAEKEGWGNRDGDEVEAAVARVRRQGFTVDFNSGYVGWPSRSVINVKFLDDARRIAECIR